MHRELFSGYILSKVNIKMMFRYDKLLLTRGSDFISWRYNSNAGLFVLDKTCEVLNGVKYASASAYIAESLEMWHARHGH